MSSAKWQALQWEDNEIGAQHPLNSGSILLNNNVLLVVCFALYSLPYSQMNLLCRKYFIFGRNK